VNEDELDELLSRPTAGAVEALRRAPGDVVLLGAGGKMGPTLARMVRRAALECGGTRRVIAVSRFASPDTAWALERAGVEVFRADLTDRQALDDLPDAPNVIFMAGQKFGTRALPALTWVTNTVVPGLVADRYRDARIVAFSTGNVYALSAASAAGSAEHEAPGPSGEYAWSCLGRERVLEYASRTRGTAMVVVRLNYAVDLRYGVLVDIALRVAGGEPIDLRMGYVNVIWQGDANAQVVQCLAHAAVPPFVVNVTGPERLSVRDTALELGRILGRDPVFTGREESDALLSDTSLAQSLFGRPAVSADALIGWVGEWVRAGRPTLGKATRFEEREGRF
jgi:nucleoside-diphosphate-sugar epimerase